MFTSDSRSGQKASGRGWRLRLLLVALGPVIWLSGSWVHTQLLSVITAPWDKLIHLTLYAVVALLIGALTGVRKGRDLWRVFLLAALIGTLDEGLQYFDATRQLDVDDLVANLVGASIGTALHAARWQWRVANRRRHDPDSLITHR